jgi:hypothetical protein
VKIRKELIVANSATAAAAAAAAAHGELLAAKESLQGQFESERQRLQQLELQHAQTQQLLQIKLASMAAAAIEREKEHAAVVAELQHIKQKRQHAQVQTEYSGGQLNRTATVECSFSEGDLAQQVPKLLLERNLHKLSVALMVL